MIFDGFYRAFEERHRGTRESIKNRLKIYLPFVAPLLDVHQNANALDLGCGRGEWLELMLDNGFEVHGIDLDEEMLQACKERALPISKGDALSYLKGMSSESISVISGFHIVEHIPFEALQELVGESLRVLRPGGVLILETPNSENIVVGTTNFYLDPTHIKPIPPELMAFIPEYVGFQRSIILRLQESEDLTTRETIGVLDVLAGVSPDFAVVAQKHGERSLLARGDEAFEKEVGLSLHKLADRFDQELRSTLEKIENKLYISESKSQQAEAKAERAEVRALRAEALAEQVYHTIQDLKAKSRQAEIALNAMMMSTSWRVTKPLRISGKVLLLLKNSGRKLLRTIFPKTSYKGRLIYNHVEETPPMEQAHLTPRARHIYQSLKRTIEKNQ